MKTLLPLIALTLACGSLDPQGEKLPPPTVSMEGDTGPSFVNTNPGAEETFSEVALAPDPHYFGGFYPANWGLNKVIPNDRHHTVRIVGDEFEDYKSDILQGIAILSKLSGLTIQVVSPEDETAKVTIVWDPDGPSTKCVDGSSGCWTGNATCLTSTSGIQSEQGYFLYMCDFWRIKLNVINMEAWANAGPLGDNPDFHIIDTTLAHELGHTLGLAHGDQLMSSYMPREQFLAFPTLNPCDRAKLDAFEPMSMDGWSMVTPSGCE